MSNKSTFPPKLVPVNYQHSLISPSDFGMGYVITEDDVILFSNTFNWIEISNVQHIDSYINRPQATAYTGYAVVADKLMYSDGMIWSVLHTTFSYSVGMEPDAGVFGVGYAIFDNCVQYSNGIYWTKQSSTMNSYTASTRPIPSDIGTGFAIVDNVLQFCDGVNWTSYINTGVYALGDEPLASANNGRYIVLDGKTVRSTGAMWKTIDPVTVSHIELDPDLMDIAGITGSFGYLKKISNNDWMLDTNIQTISALNPNGSLFMGGGGASSYGVHDIAIGYNALKCNTSGSYNIATGVDALLYNTSGSNNIATGRGALRCNTTGSYNIATGRGALLCNTSGFLNIATGSGALYYNTTGWGNIATGWNALRCNTSGSHNIATGPYALKCNTTGFQNIATGKWALNNNTTGSDNIATGPWALVGNTTGSYNIATGPWALVGNTTGSDNIATGRSALYYNTTGCNNIATGIRALYYNTTGSNNIATGYAALRCNTSGYYNIATGRGALRYNSTGSCNIATGVCALYYNTTGYDNIATGKGALKYNTTGHRNIAAGPWALKCNTAGGGNIATGFGALANNTTSSYNIATGPWALNSNTTGCYNIATGYRALYHNTTGSCNIATGRYALKCNTTGSNNTIIGSYYGCSTLNDTVAINAGSCNRIKVNSTGLYMTPVRNDTVNNVNNVYYNTSTSEITYGPANIDILYSDLYDALIAGTLHAGKYYNITDYQTVYDQPDFDNTGIAKIEADLISKTGAIEPLMVLATSSNTLSPQAWSSTYPEDFITYDIHHTATEIKGTPCKGRIALRIDDEGNQTPYDSRGVQLKRYESSPASGIFNSYMDNGGAYLDNIPTFGPECENIRLSPHHSDMGEPIGSDDSVFLVSNNVFGISCESIVTGGDFYNNTFGDLVFGVTFGHWCRGNLFGASFYDNHILNNFSGNVIGDSFNNNMIGNNFSYNVIGNSFMQNDIDSGFVTNTIGDGFFNNTTGNDFARNTIGTAFAGNHINDSFQDNPSIGDNFSSNTIGHAFMANTIDNGFQYNEIKCELVAKSIDAISFPICFSGHSAEFIHVVNGELSSPGQVYLGWFQSNNTPPYLFGWNYTGV